MRLTEKGIIAATRMFRDQIYTHKEWAVVREILCNAIDEHRKHGITRPIKVTLPTMDDPHFRVRDFAKGLDKEGVFNVFFQYFASTKDGGNDDIGGFGIGAKSPLAYSDVFFVDSYHAGHKTSYVANIDGEASTAHSMALSDSSETGIEVAIPVETRDFDKFASLTQYFVQFADFSNFEFVGRDIETTSIDWTLEFESARVGRFESPFKSRSGIFAKVADVLYPIEESSEFKNPFYQSLVLDLSNGSVDIHPSRERLDLSKRNVFVIKQAIDKVNKEAAAKVDEKMKAAKTADEKFKAVEGLEAFKTAIRNVTTAPSPMWIEKKDLSLISWDQTSVTKRDLKGYFARYDTRRGFKPFMRNLHENNYWSTDKTDLGPINMLLVSDKTVRQEYVVAYCKKHGIASPVAVIKNSEAPEGWVENSDFWNYYPDKVAKAEAKAVRDSLGLSTGGGTKKAKPSGSAVMGYAAIGRTDYASRRFDQLDSNEKYLLVPQDAHNVHDISSFLHYAQPLLDRKVLFVFQTNRKVWKNSEIDFVDWKDWQGEFKKFCQAVLDKAQDNDTGKIPTELIDYASNSKKYQSNGDMRSCAADYVGNFFPDMKANTPKQKLWDAANVLYEKLSDEEKELCKLLQEFYSLNSFPILKSKAKAVADKVFV